MLLTDAGGRGQEDGKWRQIIWRLEPFPHVCLAGDPQPQPPAAPKLDIPEEPSPPKSAKVQKGTNLPQKEGMEGMEERALLQLLLQLLQLVQRQVQTRKARKEVAQHHGRSRHRLYSRPPFSRMTLRGS